MSDAVILSPVTEEGNISVTTKSFLESHQNNFDTTTVFQASKNYYSTGTIVIDSGVTLTIPASSNYFIVRPS